MNILYFNEFFLQPSNFVAISKIQIVTWIYPNRVWIGNVPIKNTHELFQKGVTEVPELKKRARCAFQECIFSSSAVRGVFWHTNQMLYNAQSRTGVVYCIIVAWIKVEMQQSAKCSFQCTGSTPNYSRVQYQYWNTTQCTLVEVWADVSGPLGCAGGLSMERPVSWV